MAVAVAQYDEGTRDKQVVSSFSENLSKIPVYLVSMSAHGISIYVVPTPYPHRTLAWHRDTLLSIIGPWLLHQPWPT